MLSEQCSLNIAHYMERWYLNSITSRWPTTLCELHNAKLGLAKHSATNSAEPRRVRWVRGRRARKRVLTFLISNFERSFKRIRVAPDWTSPTGPFQCSAEYVHMCWVIPRCARVSSWWWSLSKGNSRVFNSACSRASSNCLKNSILCLSKQSSLHCSPVCTRTAFVCSAVYGALYRLL